LDENMIGDLRSIELYDYWDGEEISDYVDDSETTDDSVEEINRIQE
jgi:hypothetical protein